MDRGPLNYDRQGIIKHRICVENVPEVEQMGILPYLKGAEIRVWKSSWTELAIQLNMA